MAQEVIMRVNVDYVKADGDVEVVSSTAKPTAKDKLIAEAKELGIEIDGLTKAQLTAAIKEKKEA